MRPDWVSVYERLHPSGQTADIDRLLAIRALTDIKSGSQPEPRINLSHRTDGRSTAMLVLRACQLRSMKKCPVRRKPFCN